ncbi:hypothetical protein [Vallitalea maricola]|uniref:Uncharacterized protein n=1 Tax=Vallitalea maricola TaxID=3074433 RepID=A0ACB5UKR6_9FIRM|nr:hypothetical protein AN2V17_28010 [Vallitalea sp. AN17-2]
MLNKHKINIKKVILVLIIILIPVFTYSIDSKLVLQDKKPIFVVKTGMYKDGGTTEYWGLGYQVIKWNMLTIDGYKFGYEIFHVPNFRDVNDGPVKKLKLIKD